MAGRCRALLSQEEPFQGGGGNGGAEKLRQNQMGCKLKFSLKEVDEKD